MILRRRYYDADGSGGGTATATADGAGGAGSTKVDGSGGGNPADGAGGAGTTGSGGAKDPKGQQAGQKKLTEADYQKQISDLEAKNAELKKGNDTLSTKIGKFGNLEKMMKESPRDLISRIAMDNKLQVKFAEEPDGLPVDDDGKIDPANLDKYMEKRDAALEARMEHRRANQLTAERENQLRQKYDDWDTHKDRRENLRASQLLGETPPAEIFHLALRGLDMPNILEAHKAQVIEEYQAELAKKTGGDLGGGGTPGAKKPETAKSQFDLDNPEDRKAIQAKYGKNSF